MFDSVKLVFEIYPMFEGTRHSFASLLVNNGRSLYEVQKLLHHSTPIMTQRYAHLSTKTLQEASNAAGDAIQAAMDKAVPVDE